MAITYNDALMKLLAGFWNKNAKTDANPGGMGANGHVDNFPAALEAVGVVGQEVATLAQQTSSAASQVDTIAPAISAVASIADAIETVAEDSAAVQSAAANMAAIIDAPAAAAAAAGYAGAAEGEKEAAEVAAALAQAAVGGVRVTSQDTIAGALSDKIEVAGGLTKQVINPGANEKIMLTAPDQIGNGGEVVNGSRVLTASSPAVQDVFVTYYGQSVTLPDATTMTKGVGHFIIKNSGSFDLAIKDAGGTIRGFVRPSASVVAGLVDNASAAGRWTLPGAEVLGVTASLWGEWNTGGGYFLQVLSLSATKTLLLFGGTNRYAVILDEPTGTFGAAVLVGANYGSGMKGRVIDSGRVLVLLANNAVIYATVLSISGTAITVGTFSNYTLAGNFTGFGKLIEVDGSYAVSYLRNPSTSGLLAMTVSGSAVTLGSETSVLSSSQYAPHLFNMGGGVLLAIGGRNSGTSIHARPYAISGTTITYGTEATWTASGSEYVRVLDLQNGRIAVFYTSTSSAVAARVISLSGTTATASDPATMTDINGAQITSTSEVMLVAPGKAVIVTTSGVQNLAANILTDNAGEAEAGGLFSWSGQMNIGANCVGALQVIGGVAHFILQSLSPDGYVMRIGLYVGGSAPSLVQPDFIEMGAGQFAAPIDTDFDGTRQPNVLRAGNRTVVIQDPYAGPPIMFGHASAAKITRLPEIDLAELPNVISPNLNEGWVNRMTTGYIPAVVQRVTLAQP